VIRGVAKRHEEWFGRLLWREHKSTSRHIVMRHGRAWSSPGHYLVGVISLACVGISGHSLWVGVRLSLSLILVLLLPRPISSPPSVSLLATIFICVVPPSFFPFISQIVLLPSVCCLSLFLFPYSFFLSLFAVPLIFHHRSPLFRAGRTRAYRGENYGGACLPGTGPRGSSSSVNYCSSLQGLGLLRRGKRSEGMDGDVVLVWLLIPTVSRLLA